MFTPDQREQLRSELIASAASDLRISGVAITGSGAEGALDAWSDIDLAFALAEGVSLPEVLTDWTNRMYRHGAVQHLDVPAGPWLYRVFLLSNTLQVDLAFVPETEFRPLASSFRLISGRAQEPRHMSAPSPNDLIGFAWLYALHARSSIERGKLWQAEYMISAMRDHALTLACVARDLPSAHGKGFDLLPAEVTRAMAAAIVRQLERSELRRAFGICIEGLLHEVAAVRPDMHATLRGVLRQLSGTLQ